MYHVFSRYFQTLAVNTLTELYEMNRQEAYVSLVAMLPFDLGRYVTPITIARDASAMRFMSHACCQTYINLVWMKNMDLDTPYWLVTKPIFHLLQKSYFYSIWHFISTTLNRW